MTYETDIEFAETATYDIDAEWLRSEFPSRYGRGWQSKLASSLGVAQSTVSTWLKKDEIPTWAKLAIAALTLRHGSMRAPTRRVVRDGDHFAIYDYKQPVGVRIADNIVTAKVAFQMAASKQLEEACGQAKMVLEDADMIDAFGDLIEELGEALQAAEERQQSEEGSSTETGEQT